MASTISFSFLTLSDAEKDCSMTVTYSEMAFINFKKAYQAKSVEDARPFIKKGVEEAAEASAYAINPNCDCAIAKNYALNAVTFGNKAAKADSLSDCKKFAKMAMDMALDVTTATPNCK